MEAYIDLSFVVFIFNYTLSLVYSLIIFDNVKYNLTYFITSIFIGIICFIINTFFIPYFLLMIMTLYSLIVGLFALKYIKITIITILIYYFNCSLLLLIGGCFLYEGILLISIPFVTLFILIEPIYITIIHLIANIIFKKIKYHKYTLKCQIKVSNKTFKGKGYYDSGNSLTYEDIPVIFIKGKPISNDGIVIKISGINDYCFTYLAYKAILTINKKTKNVYAVFINKNINFNNCHFLLNKYVL